MTSMDAKNDAKVMPKTNRFGKTNVRYWADAIFRRKRGSEQDADWTAQIQFLKRREQFPLGTPNKAAAAAKARDIYLSLQARGWDATLAQYKAKAEEPKIENSTVGDLIKAVAETATYTLFQPHRRGQVDPGSAAGTWERSEAAGAVQDLLLGSTLRFAQARDQYPALVVGDLGKSVLRIERTRYFQPKSEESAGEVDLAPELVGLLQAWRQSTAGEFVVNSANQPRYEASRTNYRAQREFKTLAEWLEEHGVSARKKLHELRKECGAVIANTLGIFAASRALRHADIRITSHYYTDKKVRITTGLDALLA